MKIFQSYVQKKDLAQVYLSEQPRFQEKEQVKDHQCLSAVSITYLAISSTIPDMTEVSHINPNSRFIDIKRNLKRQKPQRAFSNFEKKSGFSCIDNVRNLNLKDNAKDKDNANIFKTDNFSSRTDPRIFTSLAPEVLEISNEARH